MELLVNPANYSNATDLINIGVHSISIGMKEFSVRNNCTLDFDQIKKLVDSKKKTKVLILVNRFFFEPEITKLTEHLKEICKLSIDGIIFSDYAVAQIMYENKLSKPLIYNPETLVTNYEQFDFYLENGVSEVGLARELNKREISEIIDKKGKMRVEIQAAGYAFVMHSRWKLLTNFKNTQISGNDDLTKRKLFIREESRQEPLIIYEDDNGTNILTGYSLSLIDKLEEIKNADVIRIDSFLHDADWTLKTSKIFLEAITNLNNYTPSLVERFKNEISDLSIDKNSHGFFMMDKKDLIYLLKEDVYE